MIFNNTLSFFNKKPIQFNLEQQDVVIKTKQVNVVFLKKKNIQFKFKLTQLRSKDYMRLLFFYEGFFCTPGTILKYFNFFQKRLRRDFLPWKLCINILNNSSSQKYVFIDPIFIRSRRSLKLINNVQFLSLKVKWVGFFYRNKRIKKWIKKKYTKFLWR